MSKDLRGRTVVITGGSSGIGAAAARAFKSKGARVVITGRSAETDRLASEIGADAFHVNYASLADVKKFAKELLERYPKIDLLVNNVGGIFQDRKLTEDGHEMTFQVNHLSGFYLTTLLRARLEESSATVINTSSVANRFGRIDLSDLENARKYKPLTAYGTAKLMNILHAQEMARRFQGVKAASFHPGPVATGFAREGGTFIKLVYETPLKNLFLISPEKGADTLIWLASNEADRDWKNGGYYAKRRPGSTSAGAKNSQTAKSLWDTCEEILK